MHQSVRKYKKALLSFECYDLYKDLSGNVMFASIRCGLYESDAKIPTYTENNFSEDKCDLSVGKFTVKKPPACTNLEKK